MGGCVVSTLIGALWCRKRCDASELAGEFAYFPPAPASYAVSRAADGQLVCTLNSFYFQARHAVSLTRTQAQVVQLRSASGATNPAFWFRHVEAKITLLFSHSNAVDCGFLYRFFDELSNRLRVNVFAYEFTGYGPTMQTATPRNHTQRQDIQAAYDFLCDQKLDPARQVIAYGQSIGSYPTLHLASRQRLLGVVLHSPIAAGLQVITRVEGCCAPHRVFACLEPYPNRQLVKKLRDPLFVIHGTSDETVDVQHGQSLHAACPADCRYEPYWVAGATHEDVIESDEREYFRRLVCFFEHCELRRASVPEIEATRSRELLVSRDASVDATLAPHQRKWDMRPVPAATSCSSGHGTRMASGLRAVPEPEQPACGLSSGHAPVGRRSSSPEATPPLPSRIPKALLRERESSVDTVRSVHADEMQGHADELAQIAIAIEEAHLEASRLAKGVAAGFAGRSPACLDAVAGNQPAFHANDSHVAARPTCGVKLPLALTVPIAPSAMAPSSLADVTPSAMLTMERARHLQHDVRLSPSGVAPPPQPLQPPRHPAPPIS